MMPEHRGGIRTLGIKNCVWPNSQGAISSVFGVGHGSQNLYLSSTESRYTAPSEMLVIYVREVSP